MNKNGSMAVVGAIIIIVIILGVVFLAYMGYIPLSFGDSDKDGDMGQSLGAEKCDYAVGEIVSMFENLMGKDLNNDIGFTVVNGLNMMACGSNTKLPSEIIGAYISEFSDGWYILGDDTQVKSGFYYRIVVWGNTPSIGNCTLMRGVISGSGVTVKEWYNFNTMTITGYGTRSGYLAFALWLTS